MVPSVAFILITVFAIGYCSSITELPRTDLPSKVPEVPLPTGLSEGTTRGPHTHDEHPEDDPDHSDHAHEDLKAPHTHDEDHEHPGHDHSESGHPHEDDHPEENIKGKAEQTKSPVSEVVSKKDYPKVGEFSGNRARRGLWRRRLD